MIRRLCPRRVNPRYHHDLRKKPNRSRHGLSASRARKPPSATRIEIELVPGRGTTADILILAALWLIFVLPFVVTNRTITPVDWHGVLPTGAYGYPEPRLPHIYTLDPDGAIGADVGFAKYAADSLARATIPFWNPYQGLGQQFLAEGGSMVLYPVNWLHLLLPVKYWDLVKFLHLFLAASFLYLLAKEYGFDRAHAILCGGCAYAAGFFQGYLALGMFAGVVWTPLILVSVERVLRSGTIRPALWPGVIGVFCLMTCSHPGVALSLIIMLAAYAVVRCVSEKNLSAILKIVVPAGIGLLCAAPAWMPFLQNVYEARSSLGSVPIVLRLSEVSAILLPHLYGPIQHPGAFGDPAGSDGQYWRTGWIVPAMTYYGLAGIVFAFRQKERRMLALAGITIGLWVWITARHFNLLMYVPVLARATPYYIMGPIQILLCVLSAYGVAMLGRAERRGWQWINLLWAALIAFLLAIAADKYYGLAHPDPHLAWRSAGAAVAWSVAVPLLTWWGRRSGTVYFVALSAVIANGIAYFPSGGDTDTALRLRILPLLALIMVATAIAALRPRPAKSWAVAIATLLAVNIACVAHYRAWPKRYDPFTWPAFAGYLAENSTVWRSYGIDNYLFPNLASGFPFSTINVLATLQPPALISYYQTYLDPYQGPGTFYGISSPEPGSDSSPMHTLLKHKRYWDYAGVRYVVARKQNLLSPMQPAISMRDFAPVPLDHPIEFPITPTQPMKWIDFLVSTYARQNPGRLIFRLADAKGAVIISDSRDSSDLRDNDYIRYSIPGAGLLQPGRYLATVEFQPGRPEAMLAVWRSAVGDATYRYLLPAPEAAQPLFTQVFTDDPAGALVWRNEAAHPIVYLAPEAARVHNWQEGQNRFGAALDLHRTAFLETGGDAVCASHPDFSSVAQAVAVSNIRVERNRVRADVNAQTGGTLALVMSYAPGWSARINGARARVYRMNGAFQGACLAGPGKYQVTFEFEPPLWRVGLVCAAVGFLLLLFIGKGFRIPLRNT
jgi:Bacterial membrane protein YfhO